MIALARELILALAAAMLLGAAIHGLTTSQSSFNRLSIDAARAILPSAADVEHCRAARCRAAFSYRAQERP